MKKFLLVSKLLGRDGTSRDRPPDYRIANSIWSRHVESHGPPIACVGALSGATDSTAETLHGRASEDDRRGPTRRDPVGSSACYASDPGKPGAPLLCRACSPSRAPSPRRWAAREEGTVQAHGGMSVSRSDLVRWSRVWGTAPGSRWERSGDEPVLL